MLRRRQDTTKERLTTNPTARHRVHCRIGLWGTFDVERFGDALALRIARQQLSRRLPSAEILAFAPYGDAHPTRFDGGEPAEPLGPWSVGRMAELAGLLDCVVVTGDGLIGRSDAELAGWYGVSEDEIASRAPSRFFVGGLADLEVDCPVAWHAVSLAAEPADHDAVELRRVLAARPYVAVTDGASKRWLQAAGVEVVVVPHPAVLASRLFPSSLIETRLEYLRTMGWYPRDEPALVVQGGRDLVAKVGEIAPALEKLAAELGGAAIVLVQADPCGDDREFAAALTGVLARGPFRMPVVGIEDVAACVAGSAAVVTSSASLAATAISFGRPHASTDDPGRLQDGPTPDQLRALEAEVDASFDRVASIAEGVAAAHAFGGEESSDLDELLSTLVALRRANRTQTRRRVEERTALADQLSDLNATHAEEAAAREDVVADQRRRIDELTAALEGAGTMYELMSGRAASLEARLAAAEAELAAMRATRTFRWAAPARSAIARFRRPEP